jgi:putative endonuclease
MNKGGQMVGVHEKSRCRAAVVSNQRALSAPGSVGASREPTQPPTQAIKSGAKHRSPTQQQGDRAETRACDYLLGQGLTLLARNVGSRLGEIDLIMCDGDSLVFIEVRQRTRNDFGGAAISVTAAKQRRVQRQAQHYLLSRFGDRWPPCRFDVIAIETDVIHWIRNAF